MKCTLHMAEEDVAVLLSPDNQAALQAALDSDGDSEVGVWVGALGGGEAAAVRHRHALALLRFSSSRP